MSNLTRAFFVSLALLELPAIASASQVQEIRSDKTVVISQRTSGLWAIDDFVCVTHEQKEVACGAVIGVTSDNAVVRMKFGENQVAAGDYVQLSSDARGKGVANSAMALSAQAIPKNVTLVRTFRNRFGGSIELGPSYLFPGVFYQRALERRTCVGIQGGIWGKSPTGMTVSGFGAMASLSYYREKCFQGLWIGLSLGGYFLDLSNSIVTGAKSYALAGGAEGGYSVRLSQQLLLELTAGARYVQRATLPYIGFPVNQWLYYFRTGISWQF